MSFEEKEVEQSIIDKCQMYVDDDVDDDAMDVLNDVMDMLVDDPFLVNPSKAVEAVVNKDASLDITYEITDKTGTHYKVIETLRVFKMSE